MSDDNIVDENEQQDPQEPQDQGQEEKPYIDSILTSVKKQCNISKEITAFDPDIVMLINTSFAKLHQMGVGPEETYMIEDDSAVWDDFYTNKDLNMVRTYVYMDVRLAFDPPAPNTLTYFKEKLTELEWRLNVADDEPIDRTDQNGTDSDDI